MISSKLVPVLAVIDAILLGVILFAGRPAQAKPSGQQAVPPAVTEEAPYEAASEVTYDAASEAAEWEEEPQEETVPETVVAEDIVPEAEEPYEEPSETSVSAETDAAYFDTSEPPTMADFMWITPDILNGICPPDEQAMMFDEALGGWKCYVFDEYAERFANMYFEGAEDDLTLTFDWGYISVGVYEDVYEDTTPDFVYHGTLASSGNVEADGSGRVVLTDFYRLDDHQYAFGSMYWPDGVTSHLMLVRP